jgi:dihydrofolate reductase
VSEETSKGFSIVVAMDKNRGIGNQGGLPWPKLKGDMKFFRELTTCPDREAVEKRWGLKPEESSETSKWEEVSANLKFAHKLPEESSVREEQNAVWMGRKTWESLPESYKPLPKRYNVLLTRNRNYPITKSVAYAQGEIFDPFFFALSEKHPVNFIIGGAQIFGASIKSSACVHLYITEIDAEFECDTHFPETPDFTPVLSSPWIEESGIRYRFTRWDRA